MQVSVETIGNLGRRLTIEVPAEQFEQAFASRLQRLSRQVKMPGFRPGKVPAKVVEARYRGQLLEEAAGELIERTLREALGTQNLRLAGGTRIEHKPLARGQGLQYTAEFEVYPEIKQLDLAGVEVERPVAEISDADVDRTLETLRRQRITWNAVERSAQKDDQVVIDFVGRLDGVEFDGGKAQGYPLVLGSGTLLEEMEQGLIGAKRDETRNVAVKFPDDYRNQMLAGKAADFEIRVNLVNEPALPEVNDEFAKLLGVAEGGVEKLRAEVRANLEREAGSRARAVLRRNVLKALRDANTFDTPESLVTAEIERMQRIAQSMSARSGTPMPNGDGSFFRQRATGRVALGLILAEVVHARAIKADPARIRARVEDMAKDYEAPERFVEWYYSNPERLGEVESTVLEERIVEELLGTSKVRDQTVPLTDLLAMDVSIE
ncbi:MAG: trigger factor [Gammaproteobacteria bacterium]|nr:trigger factor [Gammaproteobacteria bacterium]